ncbi:hypothetical protein BJY00DRAFT_185458 [Aspergillus carlsbadensis]|nr:hypothetical protein BJY00DRAFT_185458 [Aspergillus carlsbadensis]
MSKIVLCIKFIFIRYFVAVFGIRSSHQKYGISLFAQMVSTTKALRPDWSMRLDISKTDLMTAFTGLKNVFKRLVALNLTSYLPISATAYIAFPLLLISLDVELSRSKRQKKQRMQDLSIYAQAKRQYGHRFRFAQFVSDIVCKVLQLLRGTSWSISLRRANENQREPSTVEVKADPELGARFTSRSPSCTLGSYSR